VRAHRPPSPSGSALGPGRRARHPALGFAVTEDRSVADAVREVEDCVGSVEVLVNNAGVAGSWAPAPEVGAGELRGVFETNVFAPTRVTRAFLPLLRRRQQQRLVMVSSGRGPLTLQLTNDIYASIAHLPYPASKAALNILTVQYTKALPRCARRGGGSEADRRHRLSPTPSGSPWRRAPT